MSSDSDDDSRARPRVRYRRASLAIGLALVLLFCSGALSAAAQEREAKLASEASRRVATSHELRVCADPNNLPFSNSRGEGFENALATLVARDLGKTVRYTWWPQRRGFIRNTLRARECDVVMGIPTSFELARATIPYYRSSYVFVTRRDRHLRIDSFDDARLRNLRIGLHVIGDDYSNPPPAQALAARGLARNVRGYMIYGAYSKPSPARDLIDAVANGDVDVAVAWGPLAGYFAGREAVPLDVTPVVSTGAFAAALPMAFDIAMGVRRDDVSLRELLERVINHRLPDIRRLLLSYGIPLLALGEPQAKESPPKPASAPAPTPTPASTPTPTLIERPVGPIPGGGVPPAIVSPYANDASALEAGRRLFGQFNCGGCHGEHGGGGMGPSLRDETWIYGHSPAQLFDSISQGRAHGMPAWGTRLPPQQIWILVAYVESLRTPREPRPPE